MLRTRAIVQEMVRDARFNVCIVALFLLDTSDLRSKIVLELGHSCVQFVVSRTCAVVILTVVFFAIAWRGRASSNNKKQNRRPFIDAMCTP